MKIKAATRAKYAHFLALGAKECRPLPSERIPLEEQGDTAINCFHILESMGQYWPCREPLILEQYITGKKLHGVTVDMLAEDVFSRVIFNNEVWANYPEWMAKEIFAAAGKVAMRCVGFIPKFISSGHDFTNPDEAMQRRIDDWKVAESLIPSIADQR